MDIKVGLFNDSFPPAIDGVANAMLNYASIINEKYGTPIVITPRYPNVVDVYPFEVYRYSSVDFSKTIPYRVGNPFLPNTILELKRQNMDIMHVHCPFASAVLARQINNSYIKKNRLPIVFTYHTKFGIDLDKFVPNKKFNKIARTFVLNNIKAADEVWAVSEGAGEDLKQFGYQGEYRVMPNGTDFAHKKASESAVKEINRMYSLDPEMPVLLFVGRMMWYKNLKLILDTLKIVAKAGYKFKAVFVGDGNDRPAVEQYTRMIGMGDNVIFTGAVYDREKVRAFFSRADLFLFPSTYDTSGLVVREAAACDCASLLIKGSCAAEGVEDGVSGLLAEENAESCAEKVIELFKGENAFKKLGDAAGEKIYYSWEKAVAVANARYHEILKERGRL